MLPKTFHKQNKKNREEVLSTMKLYTITYDYDLTYYYANYIKDSYSKFGNIIDPLGSMQITGYNEEEVIFNFHQLINTHYIETKKLKSVEIQNIKTESFINKSVS